MNESKSSSCHCGGQAFRPVDIDRGPHRPLYRTEFVACEGCGAMFHRHTRRTLFSAQASPPYVERAPAFRPEVDTSDWTPPPKKVWTDKP